MKTEYKIVLGMAFMGGVIVGTVIYIGGLFAPRPVVAAPEPTLAATLPPPDVSTVLPPPPPTATTAPTATAEPILRARISHYYPAWGPPNCISANWDGVKCSSLLSDGQAYEHWSYFENWGMACPGEFPLGTKMALDADFGTGIWTCVDRGGAIQRLPDGTFFLDLLTRDMPYIPPGEAEVIYDDYSPSGSYVVTVKILE